MGASAAGLAVSAPVRVARLRLNKPKDNGRLARIGKWWGGLGMGFRQPEGQKVGKENCINFMSKFDTLGN
jgi:hypothetical protein